MRAFWLLLIAPPLAAQGFDGTVTLRFPKDQVPAQMASIAIKGDRQQIDLHDDADHVVVFRFLFDGAERTLREGSFVNRVPSQSSAVALPPEPVPAATPVTLVALEKHRKVAGIECVDHRFEADGRTLQGCFATTLGRFVVPAIRRPIQMHPKEGAAWALGFPAWAAALNGSELFPLKVWDAREQVLMEAKSIERGALPRCFFEIPAVLSAGGGMIIGRVVGGGAAVMDRDFVAAREGMMVGSLAGAPVACQQP